MTSAIDDLLAYHVGARHTPGALVHVEREGRVLARHAVGRLRGDGDAPMHDGARFRIASLTKPVVTMAALMLADEGRLELDAPVSRYLPVLAGQRLGGGVPAPRPATVRDLMRHTSGIAYPGEIADAALRASWTAAAFAPAMAGVDSAGFLARLAALPLVAAPGTAFRYGYSTDVLGCIVEALDGCRLGESLRRRIFEPLAMHRASFECSADESASAPAAFAEDAAWHASIPPIGRQREQSPSSMDSGGGGIVCTLDDYAAFARLLADGGAAGTRRLISAAAFAEMSRNQLPEGVEGPSGYTGAGFGFGLGLAVRNDWGAAAMPCSAGELTWSGISGTALFVQPRERWFALMFSSNMTSRMLARLEFRRAVSRI